MQAISPTTRYQIIRDDKARQVAQVSLERELRSIPAAPSTAERGAGWTAGLRRILHLPAPAQA
ncbi:MAG: hypothetical protein ACJ761_01515 [Chloroflexota bacterium]